VATPARAWDNDGAQACEGSRSSAHRARYEGLCEKRCGESHRSAVVEEGEYPRRFAVPSHSARRCVRPTASPPEEERLLTPRSSRLDRTTDVSSPFRPFPLLEQRELPSEEPRPARGLVRKYPCENAPPPHRSSRRSNRVSGQASELTSARLVPSPFQCRRECSAGTIEGHPARGILPNQSASQAGCTRS
jgi:hypothetical protein